jgi:hypothetical protein
MAMSAMRSQGNEPISLAPEKAYRDHTAKISARAMEAIVVPVEPCTAASANGDSTVPLIDLHHSGLKVRTTWRIAIAALTAPPAIKKVFEVSIAKNSLNQESLAQVPTPTPVEDSAYFWH